MGEEGKFEEQLRKGLELPPENRYYFNGYTISISPPDFVIVLKYNDQPIAYLNTSHTIAKTLAKVMTNIITGFENKTKQHIFTLDEIDITEEEMHE
ncbi:MAG: hypothetical protein A2W35_10240 [Chloroflexi bacterium RBG_16_57_11]|nr:MAG: hypothetical protein A2W35_10240 [Chloroflexi bacterium RBG_16_57_11]